MQWVPGMELAVPRQVQSSLQSQGCRVTNRPGMGKLCGWVLHQDREGGANSVTSQVLGRMNTGAGSCRSQVSVDGSANSC